MPMFARWRVVLLLALLVGLELFTGVLERGFVAAIATKANVAGGVNIQYVGESVSGDQAVVATTLLGRSGSDVPVDYRMVRRGDRWKGRASSSRT